MVQVIENIIVFSLDRLPLAGIEPATFRLHLNLRV